ncbi:protein ENHANCED DISEASE RESISTANCE 2-like [Andrographis paniculata]|uniref:protein ENHANCED DISEASE RESISTANCE 2-like n=1 Tax=Andrographis paniculata TaxID=175694 RepID=UPI0021E74B1A|nr:protein ENHANCED DISEASE RESISTANCE 2-like [Andrographis paniculata]XP_051137074.1 protein ENHANCED DISEASE RESISTANCE 2-like [Andrographis paniculata]XP_051137075.1 protein ENHANCED DISEASE RESISTANCE 2-like [Andrographis paniculata]XP_051137076.1 protein ENHANCED DISEASE RESISTANCE 2-like [Andrographis paniculata]XP_051137077.1 protein ENHANCED DISEASE RESISTANCE 2-like [Andrographis paniculata]
MCPTKHKKSHLHQNCNNRTNSAEDWREEAINGGSLKQVDLHTGSNGWASPPGELFLLRGPNYFSRKVKNPAGEWLLNPAGVDWLRSNAKLDHVLARPDNRVMNALRASENREKSSKTFIVAVNLQVPGRDHYSAVFYFSSKIDQPINSNPLLHEFINDSDAFRSSRFKIVSKIVKGPWILRTAVGNYSACLLGKALNCYYHRGPNYLEIDVDIGSSAIASAILRLALGSVTAVTVDMGFLVEAQKEEELPEKIFGAVRICQMEMSSATFVDSATPTSKVLPMSSGGDTETEED